MWVHISLLGIFVQHNFPYSTNHHTDKQAQYMVLEQTTTFIRSWQHELKAWRDQPVVEVTTLTLIVMLLSFHPLPLEVMLQWFSSLTVSMKQVLDSAGDPLSSSV